MIYIDIYYFNIIVLECVSPFTKVGMVERSVLVFVLSSPSQGKSPPPVARL